jgi:hypothetical protein
MEFAQKHPDLPQGNADVFGDGRASSARRLWLDAYLPPFRQPSATVHICTVVTLTFLPFSFLSSSHLWCCSQVADRLPHVLRVLPPPPPSPPWLSTQSKTPLPHSHSQRDFSSSSITPQILAAIQSFSLSQALLNSLKVSPTLPLCLIFFFYGIPPRIPSFTTFNLSFSLSSRLN